MKDKCDLSAGVLAYLQKWHTGAERSVSSAAIEHDFDINGRVVRQIINKLRCEGQPVCSDANGYYYAKNKDEIDGTITQLLSRTKKINAAARGLVRSHQIFGGEMEVRR